MVQPRRPIVVQKLSIFAKKITSRDLKRMNIIRKYWNL